MRLPRVRFTVRMMMAAVAVMAVVLTAADQLRQRRESFEQRAKECMRKVSTAIMDEQSARVSNRFNSVRLQHQCDLLGLPLGEREPAAGGLEPIGLGDHVELEVGLELAGSEPAVLLLLESDV